jgi:hypothetical protein
MGFAWVVHADAADWRMASLWERPGAFRPRHRKPSPWLRGLRAVAARTSRDRPVPGHD